MFSVTGGRGPRPFLKSLAVLRRSGWPRAPARPLPCFAAAGLAAEAAACAALAVTAVAVTAAAALAVAVAVAVAWARGWLSSLRRFVCCFGATCARA